MRAFALGFVAGVLLLQHAATLPEPRPALAGFALLLATRLFPGRPRARAILLLLAGAALGFGHAAWRAGERMGDALPPAWEGRDVRIAGTVASLPRTRPEATQFRFTVEDAGGAPVPRHLLLAWYAPRHGGVPPAVAAGDRWSLTVRLKRPRGLANPHAFDFEAWALEQGIRATGYVRDGGTRIDGESGGMAALHRWRGRVRAAMLAHLGEAPLRGVLVALAIGDQDAIPASQWQVFWRTGVGHLMSISGLHITMLASLGFVLAHGLWARMPPLASRWPARKAAAVAGTAVALGYALATGFAVPAQRTFAMLAAVALCVLGDRHGSPSRVLALAALAVVALDPWAVLSSGFRLSFGAVAAIFFVMGLRTGRLRAVRAALLEQAAVTVAMAPMLLALFHEASLVSPLANLAAIPVVSLAVVPLALAGAFLDLAAALHAAHFLMDGLMPGLEALAALPWAVQERHAPPPWALAAALAGCAWLLAPRGVPLRSLGLLWMLPLVALAPPRPPPGAAWLEVLDVGHGLAVVARTANHALAFDAGPSWSADSGSGERIVVPFLRGEGVARLDALVVSHADDDHAGGAAFVAASRRPPWLLSSLPPGHALHALAPWSTPCRAGQRWQWDGVAFEVLHPGAAAGAARNENDRSCVLRIATRGAAALLTGDIEARAEAQLLARGPAPRASVLLVPHHGSRTSSTAAFLDAVAPSVAVVSTGHRNRFGHPHPAVVARYRARGIALRRTDREGSLRIVLPVESAAASRVEPHARAVRYWSERRRPP